LRERDEELAVRLQQLEDRVAATVCACAGGGGETEVVDRCFEGIDWGMKVGSRPQEGVQGSTG